MEHPKRLEPDKCYHLLYPSNDEEATTAYWECDSCGAVAFFDPSNNGMLIPRES